MIVESNFTIRTFSQVRRYVSGDPDDDPPTVGHADGQSDIILLRDSSLRIEFDENGYNDILASVQQAFINICPFEDFKILRDLNSSSNATSPSLIARVQRQEPDAWQRLLTTYGPLVYHWCERTGLNAADSSDVMQNVFLAVSKSVHKFEKQRESDSFRGWLWTITRNKVRDFCRKQARQVADAAGGTNAYAQLAAVSEQLSDDSMSVTSPGEISGLLHRAMEMVKAEFEHRTWNAFWRSAVENEPTAEIAAHLGITANSVRQAKSRVLRRLREELGDLPIL